MANFIADVQTLIDGPAYGQPLNTRMKANRAGGRMRYFSALYRAPASGTAPAIGDKIIWGKLPGNARVLPQLSTLAYNTGTASCTLNVGDQFLATRYLSATAIDTAGTTTLANAIRVNTVTGDVTSGSATITNVKGLGGFTVGGIITGTGIPTATYVTAIDKQAKTVTMSAAGSATNTGVTITSHGIGFETSDDTSNITNAYASTTDDCTIISTVAGAQIANNQVLSLQLVYVLD